MDLFFNSLIQSLAIAADPFLLMVIFAGVLWAVQRARCRG